MENFTNSFFPSQEKTLNDSHHQKFIVYRYFFEKPMIAGMILATAILGSVGNSLVIVAVAGFKKLRTTTNIFVANLAVADVLACLFMPWQAAAILARGGWPIPGARWVCTLASFVTVVTLGCSINSLALIAINRWVGITKSPLTAHRVYTTRKVVLMTMLSWGIPLGCALTPVLTDFGELGYEKLYSSCTWVKSNPYSTYYSLLVSTVFYPVQLTIITLCYTSIFCYVRKSSHKMTRSDASLNILLVKACDGVDRAVKKKFWKRQLKVTKNLVYIVLAFILCLTPFALALVLSTDWSHPMAPWAGAILLCNSCVNPMIYSTSHPCFKKAFRRMITKVRRSAGTKGSPV